MSAIQTHAAQNRVWLAATQFDAMQVPESLRDWLCDEDLLTRKLKNACGDRFKFQLRGQYDAVIDDAQAEYLAISPCAAVLREIELTCADQCCVFARTLVPKDTLTYHPWLASLDEKPLGETLRKRDDCTRSEFEFARLSPNDSLFSSAMHTDDEQPAELWARRSQFRLGDAPILVYEVFMPAISQCR